LGLQQLRQLRNIRRDPPRKLGGRSPAGFILEIDISERLFMGEAVVAPAKTAVLPVWACGLGRTLLGVEISNAY
jgi:hypothetical protein